MTLSCDYSKTFIFALPSWASKHCRWFGSTWHSWQDW